MTRRQARLAAMLAALFLLFVPVLSGQAPTKARRDSIVICRQSCTRAVDSLNLESAKRVMRRWADSVRADSVRRALGWRSA
jgi:hypothetical protein